MGKVGTGEGSGCGITIYTADVMGNACVDGGATVTGDCIRTEGTSVNVTSEIQDCEDGSYYLQWHSNVSGTFQVAVKIAEQHVVGSPTQIKLLSTNPLLSNCEVTGDGLNNSIAGTPSRFTIRFFDQFGNAANPDHGFKLGLALLKAGEKNKEARMHEDFGMECVDMERGEYLVTYRANKVCAARSPTLCTCTSPCTLPLVFCLIASNMRLMAFLSPPHAVAGWCI